jgi:multicomponent K+:H+ antiporter subunit E
MNRLGDYAISPVLVFVLTAFWLLLNQTIAPAHIVLGALVALGLAWSSSALRPLEAHARRIDVALALACIVLSDIVRSNVAVAGLVLGFSSLRNLHSGFENIPLDLRDPHGLAVLSMIVTSTPGTVWAGLSPSGDTLTLHVLDFDDEAALVALIKGRYERPLMRIFE